jgi:DNA-binding NtrC family response regulator
MPSNASILLIDDEENLRRSLAMILVREGYQVETAATIKDAQERLGASHYDLTFLDLRLPDGNGLTFLPELRSRFADMPVLVLTAHDKLDAAIEAVRQGARDYLLKPIDPPLILQRVRQILAERFRDPKIGEHSSQLQQMLDELHPKDDDTPA